MLLSMAQPLQSQTHSTCEHLHTLKKGCKDLEVEGELVGEMKESTGMGEITGGNRSKEYDHNTLHASKRLSLTETLISCTRPEQDQSNH